MNWYITPLVIATLLGESLNNKGIDPYIYTAWVLRNRLESGRWANTLEGVATQLNQFSALNEPENVQKLLRYQKYHESKWNMARSALELVGIQRHTADPTKFATHYLTKSLYYSSKRPKWADDMVVTVIKYGHVYLRERA